MNLVIEDVKDILVANNLVYFLGDNPQNPGGLTYACSLEREPTSPVKVVSLYTLPGFTQSQSTTTKRIGNEQFQVRIRCQDIRDGNTNLLAIADLLQGLGKYTPTGESYRYEGFYQEDNVGFVGENKDLKAFLYTVTFSTIRNIT